MLAAAEPYIVDDFPYLYFFVLLIVVEKICWFSTTGTGSADAVRWWHVGRLEKIESYTFYLLNIMYIMYMYGSSRKCHSCRAVAAAASAYLPLVRRKRILIWQHFK